MSGQPPVPALLLRSLPWEPFDLTSGCLTHRPFLTLHWPPAPQEVPLGVKVCVVCYFPRAPCSQRPWGFPSPCLLCWERGSPECPSPFPGPPICRNAPDEVHSPALAMFLQFGVPGPLGPEVQGG